MLTGPRHPTMYRVNVGAAANHNVTFMSRAHWIPQDYKSNQQRVNAKLPKRLHGSGRTSSSSAHATTCERRRFTFWGLDGPRPRLSRTPAFIVPPATLFVLLFHKDLVRCKLSGRDDASVLFSSTSQTTAYFHYVACLEQSAVRFRTCLLHLIRFSASLDSCSTVI